jgi:predicted dehydrogenase
MSENKLKTAILGLNDAGWLLLQAASQLDHFEIQAVADKDLDAAETGAEAYQCTAYDDYRQLIIQNEFDCLLVAAGLYSCDEYVKTAIKKKFNILKLPPAARNFEEAAELVRLAEEHEVKFAVANPGRFAQSFLTLRQFLQQGQIEHVFLITATCTVGDKQYPVWQTDPKLAGGGVLLHDCYGIIDQIVWNFAAPQQVYSLSSNMAGDKQQRLYLTEDTALVSMKFTDTCIGSVMASRCIGVGPQERILKVYGRDKTLTAGDARFTVSDCQGRISEEFEYDDQPACSKKVLENFALSIVSPDNNKLCSCGSENLTNMAVIESAYLSARTAMPEEPGRILQMAGVEPEDVRPVRGQ